jgi:acyl-CoA-dependent ceramide synthase
LSGYNPATGNYAITHDDIYFVGFCIVLFVGIRASSMKYVFAPFARHCGLSNKKRITRFSEQAWMIMYNAVFWTLGMVIMPDSLTLTTEANQYFAIESASTRRHHTS